MTTSSRFPWLPIAAGFVGGVVVLLGIVFLLLNRSPTNFTPAEITIEPGTSAAEIVDILDAQNIVRSSDLLYIALVMLYDPSDIHAGVFVFSQPLTALEAAKVLATTHPRDELLRVTFPEGFSVREFKNFLPESLQNATTTPDLSPLEGYLFPDTYYIPLTYTQTELVDLMQETFTEKTAALKMEIASSTLPVSDIIILASIVEREANDETSMGLVSGILQNRLELGMPLQVDASVAYGLDKEGTQLTRKDIETDGPYNTYTRPGLPATPIANPGLTAILAVLNPTPSPYLYYITAPDGTFYYAKTLEEHNRNIARYLE